MIGSYGSISSNLSSIYNDTSRMLYGALARIASGKKFQSASEDLIGYLKSERLETDISGYGEIRENLTTYKMYTTAAVSAASDIYENLTDMKELSLMYDDAAAASNADLMAQYTAEFNSLKAQVNTALSSTFVDGINVADESALEGLAALNLDPDGLGTLAFAFNADMPANVDALVVTTANGTDVDAQLSQALTYMEETKAYDAIIDQQLNINETIINSKEAVKSLITDIDEAEEMNNVVELQIRQQASMAMLAQGNLVAGSLLKLYE